MHTPAGRVTTPVADLSPAERDRAEERAAILEFCARFPRSTAERLAGLTAARPPATPRPRTQPP
jgi:hypothetical protein